VTPLIVKQALRNAKLPVSPLTVPLWGAMAKVLDNVKSGSALTKCFSGFGLKRVLELLKRPETAAALQGDVDVATKVGRWLTPALCVRGTRT
jgi:hypothetical protein